MFNIFKKMFTTGVLIMLLVPIATVAAASTAPAAKAPATCGEADTTSKGQILQGAGQTGTDCTGAGVDTAIKATINILSTVVGVAAVIVIIISGLKYITSGGDSNGISSAKNTLIYALVGLAVASLAQILVRFVLFQVK